MNGFLSRLVQRSRGEGTVVEPYRTPVFPTGMAEQGANRAAPRADEWHSAADSAVLNPLRKPSATQRQTPANAPAKPDSSPTDKHPAGKHPASQTAVSIGTPVHPNTTVQAITAHAIATQANDQHGTTLSAAANPVAVAKPAPPAGVSPFASADANRGQRRETALEFTSPVRPGPFADAVNPISPVSPRQRSGDTPSEQTAVTPARPAVQQPAWRQYGRSQNASMIDNSAAAAMAEQQTIDVHVHIGRIDIRATTKSPQPAQRNAGKAQGLSLSDYIQQRTGDRR